MIHLTPQEKSVVLSLCVIILSGTIIQIGLQKNVRIFNWLHTAQQKSFIRPININQASSQALLQVPGVGPAMAEFILSYRHVHGPFEDLKPLQRLKGMTPKRYERLITYFKI